MNRSSDRGAQHLQFEAQRPNATKDQMLQLLGISQRFVVCLSQQGADGQSLSVGITREFSNEAASLRIRKRAVRSWVPTDFRILPPKIWIPAIEIMTLTWLMAMRQNAAAESGAALGVRIVRRPGENP
jgi:hypothetical protein